MVIVLIIMFCDNENNDNIEIALYVKTSELLVLIIIINS